MTFIVVLICCITLVAIKIRYKGGTSNLLVETLECFSKDLPRHTDLEVVHHGDVSRRPLAQSVIHHRVPFGPGYATGRQNLIILIHTQRLPTKILHR